MLIDVSSGRNSVGITKAVVLYVVSIRTECVPLTGLCTFVNCFYLLSGLSFNIYILYCFLFYFFEDFIYFLEREGRREKERERNMMWERTSDRLPLSCPKVGAWPPT